MPGKDPAQGQGQQQGAPLPQGPPPEGNPGGTAGGGVAAGGAAAGGNVGGKGGTHPKDSKLPPPSNNPRQILQVTPEVFQQTVAAAVTAALAATQPAQVIPAATATPAPVLPRKEKKLTEFWTSRPVMWFRLFDGQFPEALSEDVRFNALLNHLPSSALPFVDHFLRAPGQEPFSTAKACLVRHYKTSPRDRARTLHSLTSLGDRTASEMLFYMRSLLPGYPDNPLFEAIFIKLLPANSRDAAVKHEVLEDMADATDKAPASQLVTSVTWPADGDHALVQVSRAQPSASSSEKRKSREALCFVHRNYGRAAFKCASPKTCSMRDVISRPDSPQVQGNANAGRQ